ncbi:MAG: hypothetical protein JW795_11500 [Chitinivibrionales bacterium]|nr:hypothetical protein [Chitinivibrionales bacterium]
MNENERKQSAAKCRLSGIPGMQQQSLHTRNSTYRGKNIFLDMIPLFIL